MKRVTMFLAVIFAIGLTTARAETKVLTLDDCIEIALEKRASIVRARGGADQAGAEKLAALGAFLPSLRASYSYSKGKETNIDPPNARATEYADAFDTTVIGSDTAIDAISVPVAYDITDQQDKGPSKNLYLRADIDLFNPSSWFNYSAASASKARAELNVLASEQDLISSVKISFYAYLASAQNVDVQEEAVKRSAEQLKLIESRYELGSAAKSDVLKQKVQYGTDQLSLLRATNGVIQAEADLAYTIGLDPREDIVFSTDYRVQEYTGTLDDAIGFSMTNNPGLLANQKAADQAKHSVRAAKSFYLPTVSAYADYSRFNGTQAYPVTFDYSSNSRTYGLSISYGIFDGFVREQRVTAARVSRNNALADLADMRNSTVSSVKSSYLEIDQLKKQREVSQENVAAAEEDLRITQEKYNLGAATILDLLNAQVSLKEAQVALIQVQFDLNLAIARLENAMGKM